MAKIARVYTSYEKVVGFFTEQECELLTPKGQYVGTKTKIDVKYKCGHIGKTTFNVFSRKCHSICTDCVHETYKLDMYNHDVKANLTCAQEATVRQTVTDLLEPHFACVKTHEGCLADIIIRPKGNSNNLWMPIQLKTSVRYNNHAHYSFSKISTYRQMLVLMLYFDDCKLKGTWLINGTLLTNLRTLSMGKTSSKYQKYQISLDDLQSILKKAFETTTFNNLPLQLKSYEDWNIPTAPMNKVEHNNRLLREGKLNGHFKVGYPTVDGCVTDCYIDGVKVQDKAYCTNPKGYYNVLLRRNRAYMLGENDLYWAYSNKTSIFFAFPESYLKQLGIFDTSSGCAKTTVYIGKLESNAHTKYMFDYNNLDITRLKDVLNEAKRFDT